MRARMLVPLLLLTAVHAAAQGSTCARPDTFGRHQSPVDIRRATASTLEPLATHYPTMRGRLFNNGHRVQVDVDSGSITVDT